MEIQRTEMREAL